MQGAGGALAYPGLQDAGQSIECQLVPHEAHLQGELNHANYLTIALIEKQHSMKFSSPTHYSAPTSHLLLSICHQKLETVMKDFVMHLEAGTVVRALAQHYHRNQHAKIISLQD